MRSIMTELKMPDSNGRAFVNDRQGAVVGKKLVTLYALPPASGLLSEVQSTIRASNSSSAVFAPVVMKRLYSFIASILMNLRRIG